MPSAKAYPLEKILDQVAQYGARKQADGLGGKKQGLVMIEYVMLAGVNDQPAHAEELAALLHGLSVVVNLIPYNPFPGAPLSFETPTADVVNAFIDVLSAHGLKVFERRHHGRDIQAACGQLAKQSRETDVRAVADVEELPWEDRGRIPLSRDQPADRGARVPRLALLAVVAAAVSWALVRRARR